MNYQKKKIKKTNGITLIALVITIIVLLILAGVTISALSGDNGILQNATKAKLQTQMASEKEQVDLAVEASKMNKNIEIDFSTLEKEIKNTFGDEAKVTVQDDAENGTSEYVISLPNGNIYKGTLEDVTDILVLETDNNTDYDASVYGYKISLDGKIGLRFYFQMPATWLEDEDKYAVLTRNGEEERIQLKQENIYMEKIDGKIYYYLTIYSPPSEIQRDMSFKIVSGNESVSKTYTFSIKKYADNILKDKDKFIQEGRTSLINFIENLLNFGGYAQIYFNEDVDKLVNEGINIDMSDVTAESLEKYVINTTDENKPEYLYKHYATAVSFEEMVKLGLYVQPIQDSVSGAKAICDGKEYELNQSGSLYYMKTDFIPYDKLSEPYSMYIVNDKGEQISSTKTCNVYSYIYKGVKSSTNEKLVNFVKALKKFSDAYIEYFGTK